MSAPRLPAPRFFAPRWLALSGLIWLCAGSALAEDSIRDCSTPRRALVTWLGNLQPDQMRLAWATQCFDWSAAMVRQERRRNALAKRLKRVLDARGLFVVMEEIPDEPELDEKARVTPFPAALAQFYLIRRGSNWLISAETIRAIPDLYADTFAVDLEGYLDSAPPWLRDRVFGAAWWQWLSLAVLLALAFFARYLVSRFIATQGAKVATTVVKRLDSALVQRVALPFGTVVMVLLLMYLFPILGFDVAVNRLVVFGLRVAAAVSAVLILYRLVDVAADVWSKRAELTDTKLDDQLVPLIRKSAKVVIVVLGAVFVLQNLDVDVSSLIAGVSLGGLAFTLAAQDTVANLFGSVSIFADQPFQVGDWVKMQGVEGVVEEVGMRSTRVRTFYRSLVSIPNSKVANGVVDNLGVRDKRRIFIKLGLQYDTRAEQMEAFCDGVRAILAANPRVAHDAYYVVFSGFGDSSLEVMLYFFLRTDTWADELRERHLLFLEVLRLADQLGVSFAFPTRTLHMMTQAKPTDVVAATPLEAEALAAVVHAFGPGGAQSRPRGPRVTHGYRPGYESESAAGARRGQGDDPDADIADSRT